MQIDCFDDLLCKTSTGTSVAKLATRPADAWDDHKEWNMPAVTMPARQKGDYLVDYEQKVFEDVKAKPGEKTLVTFQTVAFEGSIGFVNMLQATRLMAKVFEPSTLLYAPGVTLGVQRGFPKLADEAFPGPAEFSNTLVTFMAEGGQ